MLLCNYPQITLLQDKYSDQVLSLDGTPKTNTVTLTVLEVYISANSGFSDIHFLSGNMGKQLVLHSKIWK